MEVFWGDEDDSAPTSQKSSIAPMYHMPTPETRKITQITGHAPRSAILTEIQARKEINVCKADPKNIPKQFVRDFVSGKRNAAMCLNEFCQLQRMNYKFIETDPSRAIDQYGRFNFAIMAIVNGVNYRPGEGKNKKEAKVVAAKNALNELLGLNPDQDSSMQSDKKAFDTYGRSVSLHNKTESTANIFPAREFKPIPKPVTVQKTNFLPVPNRAKAMDLLKKKPVQPHENVGTLAEQRINSLLKGNTALLAAAQHGVVAQFIIKRDGMPGEVVAVGSGDMCGEGGSLLCDGGTLFDCHAETIARRAFRRYLSNEIETWYTGTEEQREKSIFEMVEEDSNLLCIKDSVALHFYMNRVPKGIARTQAKISEQKLFDPMNDDFNLTYVHNFGCEEVQVPSDIPIVITAADVLSMVKRKMVTMSGTDKIMKWNVCGVQGSLLSLFIEPVCIGSITIGFDSDDGDVRALHVALNRRVDEDLNRDLPDMFIVNHIHKIGPFQQPNSMVPFFEDTEHLSINWSKGDDLVEVIDGNTGKLDLTSPAKTQDGRSRLCKSMFYSSCIHLSSISGKSVLEQMENYYIAKQSAQGYQASKRHLFKHLRDRGLGYWVNRPKQVDGFKI